MEGLLSGIEEQLMPCKRLCLYTLLFPVLTLSVTHWMASQAKHTDIGLVNGSFFFFNFIWLCLCLSASANNGFLHYRFMIWWFSLWHGLSTYLIWRHYVLICWKSECTLKKYKKWRETKEINLRIHEYNLWNILLGRSRCTYFQWDTCCGSNLNLQTDLPQIRSSCT